MQTEATMRRRATSENLGRRDSYLEPNKKETITSANIRKLESEVARTSIVPTIPNPQLIHDARRQHAWRMLYAQDSLNINTNMDSGFPKNITPDRENFTVLDANQTAHYRAFDDIKALSITLDIRRHRERSAALKEMWQHIHSSTNQLDEIDNYESHSKYKGTDQMLEKQNENSEAQSLNLFWQEKIFSPREIEYFAKVTNDFINKRHKQYYEMIQEQLKNHSSDTYNCVNGQLPKNRIVFTYVEDPIEGLDDEAQEFLDIENNEIWAPMKINAATERMRTWFIMAAFPIDRSTAARWIFKKLCQITFVPDKHEIIFKPPLSAPSSVYRVVLEDGRIFHYTVSLTPPSPVSSAAHHARNKAFVEHLERQLKYRDMVVSSNPIRMPPPSGQVRITVYGEISHASGFQKKFDNSCLVVNFQIHLPDGWQREFGATTKKENQDERNHDQGLFRGASQCAILQTISKDGFNTIAIWNHPFGDEWITNSRMSYNHAGWPTMTMQVCAIDSRHRQTTLGYAHVKLHPLKANETFAVPTWRPTPTSLEQQMDSTFVGKDVALKRIQGIFQQSHAQKTILNHYGVPATSSGSVTLRWFCVQQSNTFITKNIPNAVTNNNAISQVQTPSKMIDVLARARARLESLQKSG